MALSQITITYISTLPSTTSTVAIPIPSSVQNLDSVSNQNASAQTGFSAFDVMVGNIVRGGGIRFTDSSGIATWIPLSQITKVQGE